MILKSIHFFFDSAILLVSVLIIIVVKANSFLKNLGIGNNRFNGLC